MKRKIVRAILEVRKLRRIFQEPASKLQRESGRREVDDDHVRIVVVYCIHLYNDII
jgi:hypothetical protein